MDKREQSTDWQVSKTSLIERFKELYKLSEWTDCSFSVGESEVELIKCHKLVLAASSPVFEALFYGPLADFDKVIHLPDLEPETFKSLLKYIYCDTTELNGIIDAGMLLYASKKYMLPHLSRICVDHIIQHLQITNLWEALDVAESLNEEELLETCLKMMRQYSVNIWSSSQEHLSSTVLCRLLDQEATNISETELWTFVLSWAETECKLKDIDPTPENIRSVIDDAGVLEKIRFLTFTKDDILELVKPSGIISESEIEELVKGIDWVNYVVNRMYCDYCDLGVNIAGCERGCGTNVTGFDIPKGFNENVNKRMRVSAYVNHCPRKLLTKRKTWTYGGTVCTKVLSQTHVLVTGFEVFTRIPSTADFCMSRNNTGLYNERLVLVICDDEGRELSKTDYNGVAEFNASQTVKLSQPVWFLPHRKYTVKFELPAGQYPLSQLSDAASCKTAVFRFEDFTNYPEGYLDFSFISAVMFSF